MNVLCHNYDELCCESINNVSSATPKTAQNAICPSQIPFEVYIEVYIAADPFSEPLLQLITCAISGSLQDIFPFVEH